MKNNKKPEQKKKLTELKIRKKNKNNEMHRILSSIIWFQEYDDVAKRGADIVNKILCVKKEYLSP